MSPFEKANALLRSLLTPEQISNMENDGWVRVWGNMGGEWLIDTDDDWVGNLRFREPYGWVQRCAHPRMYNNDELYAPAADAFIAQLLTIQTNEAYMRKVAL